MDEQKTSSSHGESTGGNVQQAFQVPVDRPSVSQEVQKLVGETRDMLASLEDALGRERQPGETWPDTIRRLKAERDLLNDRCWNTQRLVNEAALILGKMPAPGPLTDHALDLVERITAHLEGSEGVRHGLAGHRQQALCPDCRVMARKKGQDRRRTRLQYRRRTI